jgi:hypothetical protein
MPSGFTVKWPSAVVAGVVSVGDSQRVAVRLAVVASNVTVAGDRTGRCCIVIVSYWCMVHCRTAVGTMVAMIDTQCRTIRAPHTGRYHIPDK